MNDIIFGLIVLWVPFRGFECCDQIVPSCEVGGECCGAEKRQRIGEVRGGQQVDREEATLGGGYRQSVVWWWGLYSCCTLYVTPSLYFRVWSSSSQQQQVAPLIPLIILRCFRLSWHQTSLVARRMWGLRWTMDFSSSSGRWREAGMQWAGGSSDCDPDIIQLSSCRETGWQLSGL